MSQDLKQWITDTALEMGFTAVAFTDAKSHDHRDDLDQFLSQNYHGQMAWLEARKEWRASPSTLWPEANAIIMFAESYPAHLSSAPTDCGEISTYAQGRDYHDVVKKRLKHLGRALIEKHGGEIKVFVDTAPVMEKPLAMASGLGWQGKHGNILSKDIGNWFFLGSIFTTHKIEPDQPATNHCGSCTSCVDACPTNAFDANGHLDPRKCISYLTIEYDGVIPRELRKGIGNRIYGCDICLNACPWNKFDKGAFDPKYTPKPQLVSPKLAELLDLDDEGFRALMSGSPIKRIGWTRFMRNALIAAGNSSDCALIPHILRFKDHKDSVLSEAADWAMENLNG